MWRSFLKLWRSASVQARPQVWRRRSLRPTLEDLEGRTVPSTFNAATVSDLIADIQAANLTGGSNAITLAPNVTFDLTVVNNTTHGATGLPVIAANDNLTIIGQGGDIIQRDPAAPAFRLLDVGKGASLTLQNLTLQGGDAFGSGVSAEGGGIYNQGMLILNGVTIQNNVAQGSTGVTQVTHKNSSGTNGNSAAGGGIYSTGTLTLEGGTVVQGNKALGGDGGSAGINGSGGNAGNGSGGGLYIGGGTANLETGTLVQSNQAVGGVGGDYLGNGSGGNGGNGSGGGLYIGGGTVNLTDSTLSHNDVSGGPQGWEVRPTTVPRSEGISGRPGSPGNGFGGGLYVANGSVTLSGDTVDYNGHAAWDGVWGGGIYAGGGSLTLLHGTVEFNTANNYGGGLYIVNARVCKVCLDAFTVANVIDNTAYSGPNIYGPYKTC
jgi:hypothetical protein